MSRSADRVFDEGLQRPTNSVRSPADPAAPKAPRGRPGRDFFARRSEDSSRMLSAWHRCEFADLDTATLLQKRASSGQCDRSVEVIGGDERVAAERLVGLESI
jgi:hypothetical protein